MIRVCSLDIFIFFARVERITSHNVWVSVVDVGVTISLATISAKSACFWIIGAISDKQSD